MALLETIRKQTDSTWAKLVFGAVILVFIFWGIGTSGGPKTTAIVEVNGQRITDTEFHREMRNITRSGENLNESEIDKIAAKVIDQLILTEVLLQEVERLDIQVSQQEIGRQIQKIPAFLTDSGEFSPELFSRTLKRMGLTKGKFETQIRDSLALQKLEEVIRSSVTVSDAELERLFRRSATELKVSFVRIPDSALLHAVEIDEGTIDAYIAASPDDLKTIYDRDFSRLYHSDRAVQLSAIVLRTDIDGATPDEVRARLEDIRQQALSGASFADLARRYSEELQAVNGGDHGQMAAPQLEPSVAEAVFAVGSGQLTDIIETAGGLAFFSVGEITEEKTIPFEDVQRQIARDELAGQQVSTVAGAYAEELLAAWRSAGAPPQELLDRHGLEVLTVGPFSQAQPEVPGAGGSEGLIAALSAAEGEGVLDGVFRTDGGRIVAAITDYIEPDMSAFAEQKEMIRAQVLQQKQELYWQAWQADFRDNAKIVQYYVP